MAKKAKVAKAAPIPEPKVSEKQYGARPSKAKVCATCGHPYINPCATQKMLDKCPNAQWLASQPKGKKSGKAR